jgi:hypothetical protein
MRREDEAYSYYLDETGVIRVKDYGRDDNYTVAGKADRLVRYQE